MPINSRATTSASRAKNAWVIFADFFAIALTLAMGAEEMLQHRTLAFDDLVQRRYATEPFAPIGLGKALPPARFWRPDHFEACAFQHLGIAVALDRPDRQGLAAVLTKASQGVEHALGGKAGFL